MGAPPITAPHQAPPADIRSRPTELAFDAIHGSLPTALYIQRNDRLEVKALTFNATAFTFHVRVRLLLPPDKTHQAWYIAPQDFAFSFTGPGNFVKGFDLTEGFLLSVTAQAESTQSARGFLFVQVGLVVGTPVAGQENFQGQLLISGYLVGTQARGWPGGTLADSVDGQGAVASLPQTNPAAGTDFSITVPNGTRWRFISLHAILSTSATISTRTPTLTFDDGSNIFLQVVPQATQAASMGQQYNWAGGLNNLGPTAANISQAGPVALLLAAGYRIRAVTTAIQAGDQWSAVNLLAEAWVDNT